MIDILRKYNQEHLMKYYEKNKEQISRIDFEQIMNLFENTKKEITFGNDKIEPISYVDKSKLKDKDIYKKIGEEEIKKGKLAFVTMAGGQGTRLGHKGPKGTFELIGDKTLFELICSTLKDGARKYNVSIPWYIMTSRENNDETVAFFEEKNYFGYPKQDIYFFKQGELPMVNKEGKLLIDKEGKIKEAADGHGGVFEAIIRNGILADMQKRKIEWIYISGVDNPLVKMVDPIFVGLAKQKNVLVAGKSLVKSSPNEKVGVFCKRNGKPSVIEYTEISKELAEAVDENGELLFGEAHVIMNMFNIKALEKIGDKKLPYHSALKKAECLDENGNLIVPESPNAYKFESFIFDAFSSLDDMLIMRVKREEEFAPVKNAEGADSPETSRELYLRFKAKERYENWINNPYFDEKTRKELKEIENNNDEISDRFYKTLEFGTAGLRGIMGAGTNRMNIYTVGKATQGLANFILKENGEDRGVVIAYDSRNNSKEFSECTALTLNANGIKTYLFDDLRPTPELSYAVRKLNAIAGIVITASHNPSKYNGYKVYWEDGAQITSPKDKLIINEVNKIESFDLIKKIDKEDAIKSGLYNIVGKEIDDSYIGELKKLVLNSEIIEKYQKDIKIVYTPLHGTGNILVRRILSEIGFKNVIVVPEQELPDGNFPTVSYPNPEDEKAFELAIKLAKKENADIVLATDPDADRLGVYAKDSKTGKYQSFTGNMSGLLIAEYILSQKKERNQIPSNGALIKSIVSSNMSKAITNYYGIKLIEVLTGFKYIGEKIKEFEQTGKYEYLFGYEESYGCLVGTHARDKDAVVAVMMLAEAAAFYKSQGKTLWDAMIDMYEKYGYYKENVISITLESAKGAELIQQIMKKLRANHLTSIGQFKVISEKDYLNEINGLPKSNVLYYELENDAWCCVRPSGTEPKIKFYIGVKGTSMKEAEDSLNDLTNSVKELI